jgi:hypothetical protein
MQYRDLELPSEAENDVLWTEAGRQQSTAKQYRAKRTTRSPRRRVAKTAHPGYGISGRRNRRWTW